MVDTDNLGTTQTLHADETGTITLPNYSGDQTLTPVRISFVLAFYFAQNAFDGGNR